MISLWDSCIFIPFSCHCVSILKTALHAYGNNWVWSSEKVLFEHAQHVWIHISLHTRKVSSGHLVSIETFYSIRWFCLRTAKALIRLRISAVWTGPPLSAHNQRVCFRLVGLSYENFNMQTNEPWACQGKMVSFPIPIRLYTCFFTRAFVVHMSILQNLVIRTTTVYSLDPTVHMGRLIRAIVNCIRLQVTSEHDTTHIMLRGMKTPTNVSTPVVLRLEHLQQF